jgi:folylpolyglutamate synthase/dihydropteroate synthase
LNLLLRGQFVLLVVAAHTEGSAIALAKTLRDAFPKASLALVVAMACDKDHSAFAQALLKGKHNYLYFSLFICHVTAGV